MIRKILIIARGGRRRAGIGGSASREPSEDGAKLANLIALYKITSRLITNFDLNFLRREKRERAKSGELSEPRTARKGTAGFH